MIINNHIHLTNGKNLLKLCTQLTVQDLPEATTTALPSKEDEEVLDLPEVPSKPPVAQKDIPDKKKGLSLSLPQ